MEGGVAIPGIKYTIKVKRDMVLTKPVISCQPQNANTI